MGLGHVLYMYGGGSCVGQACRGSGAWEAHGAPLKAQGMTLMCSLLARAGLGAHCCSSLVQGQKPIFSPPFRVLSVGFRYQWPGISVLEARVRENISVPCVRRTQKSLKIHSSDETWQD